MSFRTADNVNVSDSEEPNQRLSLSQTCWTNVNREAICSGENEQMQITVAGKEDMWDSGCIDDESESATEEKKEKLAAGLSSAPLNEEAAKRTYAEVCAASLSNDDKGDLALAAAESTTEGGEKSLKIVQETKNVVEDDAGKAAVDIVDAVFATPSVTSDLSLEEEAKDNIDECEGGGRQPSPSSGSISGQQQGGQECPKAVSKYSKSRRRKDKKQQRRSVLQRNRRAREEEDEEDEDDDVQSDFESSQKHQHKVL